ncbi:MAG: hypothetical protein J2P37_01480 [Ktedonobacteraceae bacterium]|nr:hypothetical protein [Ktedonobacteraceae bacterium]
MITPDPKKFSLHRLSILTGSAIACLSLAVGFSAAGAIPAHAQHSHSSHVNSHGGWWGFDDDDEDCNDCNDCCCQEQRCLRIEQHVNVSQNEHQHQNEYQHQQQQQQQQQFQGAVAAPSMPFTGSDPGAKRLP